MPFPIVEEVKNDQHRMCGSALDTSDHLISGCAVMVLTMRYDISTSR